MKIKLFTANVWADVFGNPVHPRDTLLSDIISERMPDVVFFQEMHPNWHESELKPRLSAVGYRESCPDLNGNPRNCTPLMYNANRFIEVRSVFHLYTGPNDYSSKSYSAACLENKTTGERVGVLSTHFWFMWDEDGKKAREQNARELVEAFDELSDCNSVFCGGDFNCCEHDAPFRILRDAGIVTSAEIAKEKVNFICTWHGDPKYNKETGTYTPAKVSDEPNDHSIDHIVTRGAVVLRYEVVTDERGRQVSDHCQVEITAEA